MESAMDRIDDVVRDESAKLIVNPEAIRGYLHGVAPYPLPVPGRIA